MNDTFTSNINVFIKNIKKDIKEQKKNISDEFVAFIYTVYSDVMIYNPVKTGDYRLNTNMSLNKIEDFPYKKSGSIPVEGTNPSFLEINKSGFKEVAKSFKIGDTVYIYNDLIYNIYVEFDGWKHTKPYASFKKAEINSKSNDYMKNITVVADYRK